MSNHRAFLKPFLTGGLILLFVFQAACHRPVRSPEEDLLDTARQAFLDGRYGDAEHDYQTYLEHFPKGAARLEAWRRLADISQDIRVSPRKAALLLETAVLENAGNIATQAKLSLRAARLHLELKDYAKATKLLQGVIDLPGLDAATLAKACLELAHARVLARDAAGALAAYDLCRDRVDDAGSKSRCDLARARLFMQLDRTGEAEPILHTLFADQRVPASVRGEAGFALGQLSETAHDKAAARAYYEQVRTLYPNPLAVAQKLKHLK
ncbi:MAG: tol-pal system YbgF family protein [Desulfovibrio sp.]